MRTSPPPPDWASPDSWSPTKSSMRSPAQAPCSRKNNWRLRSQRLSDSSREDDDGALDSNGTARVGGGHRGVTEIVRSLESTGAAARTPELADNGGLVTSGRNGVINVGIKNTLY